MRRKRVLEWRRTNFSGVWSYACEEGLHPGESGRSVGGRLAADEGEVGGGSCEDEKGGGGSKGQVGKEGLHVEEFGFWLWLMGLRVF